MEKSYQLCDAGNKVVLRRLTEPDYEMRTVLVADELVHLRDEKQHERYDVSGLPFFVLKQDGLYCICWERRKNIQVILGCSAFMLVDNNVLLKKEECWYWWPSDADMSVLRPLGKQISSLGRLFIFKQNSDYLLNYFEDGELKTKSCQRYEIMNVDFQEKFEKPVELFPDVLSISDEKGVHYLSVERLSESQRYSGGKYFVHSYSIKFKDDSSEKLMEFTAYVRRFCVKISEKGIQITGKNNICDYAYVRDILESGQDFMISLNIGLKGSTITCISVVANISKLYRGEDESYQIYCAELEYYQPVDDVWIEVSNQEKALFMVRDGKTDKISCSISSIPEEKYLVLSRNV